MITMIDGNELRNGQQIQVYKNLHRAIFSIRDAKTRRVIAYGTNIRMSNIRLQVQKSGNERVRREKWKNIHAFVSGIYDGIDHVDINEAWNLIYYNPYITQTFINNATGEPIFNSKKAYLTEGKCYVWN